MREEEEVFTQEVCIQQERGSCLRLVFTIISHIPCASTEKTKVRVLTLKRAKGEEGKEEGVSTYVW